MDEIVKDFLIESSENLDRLDQELVKLESEPQSKDLLASIFRTIHTIKGSCGFLGFARLEKVAHAGESLLSRLRDGQLSLNAEVTSGLLAMVDAVRRMLSEIQATEHDGENDYAELIGRLKQLQGGAGGPTQSAMAEPVKAEKDGSGEEKSAAAADPPAGPSVPAAQQIEPRGRDAGV
jgi:two-component system chemotaxis sensor kinase CheA